MNPPQPGRREIDTSRSVRPADLASLRRGFTGQILLPNEDGYHQARRVWNAMADRRPAVIARCAGTSDVAAAPARATLTAWAGVAGDWPFLPRELRRQPLASVGYVWTGDPDDGRRLLPVLRGGTTPVAEQSQALTYLELQSIDDTAQAPHRRRYWKGHYLRDLTDEAIAAFLSRGARDGDDEPGPARLASGDLQAYGGAIASVGPGETAFGHRDALIEFVARAGWTDPAEDQARISAARRYGAAIEPYASGVYVNDLTDEGEEGVRRAYGTAQLARLIAIKDHYDPDNIFHLNHNIPTSQAIVRPGASAER
ncbi:MAG: BBE domain-containing protein [Streptosporangiaceae bacterium]